GQRPEGMYGEPRRASRRGLGLAEQAPGADDQDRGHHQQYEDDGDFREYEDAERVELGDQHRGDEGDDDAAEAPDHHHDEHIDDDAQVHGVMHGIPRYLQRAAEACEKYAEREHAGEQPFLIDAERRHHVAVLG